MLNMEKGDGKRQSPECPFCLAAGSYEGSLHSHPQQASVSGVGAGAPRAEPTPTHMMIMSITQYYRDDGAPCQPCKQNRGSNGPILLTQNMTSHSKLVELLRASL